eukprot:2425495-Pleurochrysis_carterae.AAC.1
MTHRDDALKRGPETARYALMGGQRRQAAEAASGRGGKQQRQHTISRSSCGIPGAYLKRVHEQGTGRR